MSESAPPNLPLEDQLQALYASALQASHEGRIDDAVQGWQQCLALLPRFPQVHHLLGAEHAQAGRYGDAVLHLSLAIEQDPALATARLQLGLLWLTLEAPGQATQVLQPLLAGPASDALTQFAAGLSALAMNDMSTAERHVAQGLSLPLENVPLRKDMEKLLASVRAAVATDAPPAVPAHHGLAISAYTGAH